MQVYGDPWRTIDLTRWRDRAAAPLQGRWIERHAEIADRLIETGQILQALEDEAFHRNGDQDREAARLDPLKAHLLYLARALIGSLDGRHATSELRPSLLPDDLPDTLVAREPEGYAFYALYPEAYALAAARLAARPDALVIGLRSIGASLAPMVAAAIGASHFTTLRPKGPPFAREIDAPDLARRLACGPARDVLIVDEGPGLSGSSFASVATFARKVAPDSKIAFLPSHAGGPGAQASDDTRALFATLPNCVTPFAESLPERLPGWVADLTGPAIEPLQDLSGGDWRRLNYASEAHWPAVDPMQERLKYLLRTERGAFLLKFTGLGDIGQRKARLAQALGDAGLAPETLGLRHGFLVTRWLDDARPVDIHRDRPRLLVALARYLAFRQQRFASSGAFGASTGELRAMVLRNVSLSLGDAAAQDAVARLGPMIDRGSRLQRMATDNRMQ
ncbi:MAG: hypothetical protein JWN07_3608, partial [Hyphomicrobiales bacterium]|nr:hypothetical protein [Hyphomicrobiales bacterium]